MAGNSFGTLFKVTTWGESHGPALGVVIDGCPSGIAISEKEIQKEVDRRRPVDPKISTTRKEADKIEILSGIFEGKTLGTPISIMVRNSDANPASYEKLKDIWRPGHADMTYDLKYGIRDYRGGGRSSGRETVARVIAGAIAKQVLKSFPISKDIRIYGHTVQVGDIFAEKFDEKEIEKNPLRCADKKAAEKMYKLVEEVRKNGDSIGAAIEIIIENTPPGIGEPVFDKLSADLGKAMLSIGAIKGFEIGNGFDSAFLRGSENNDQIQIISSNNNQKEVEFLSNNSGGVLGGISNGNTIVLTLAIKPAPSITNAKVSVPGRHDACLAPRIIPVAESMAAITILDHLLRLI